MTLRHLFHAGFGLHRISGLVLTDRRRSACRETWHMLVSERHYAQMKAECVLRARRARLRLLEGGARARAMREAQAYRAQRAMRCVL